MAVYYIKHTKADSIRFVSHLDLQRAIQRNITRADIGAVYSQGYNPHMIMSSAQPLSVGVTSDAEYIMVALETGKSPEQILEDLNGTSPEGITYALVREMPAGAKPPMALLDAVDSKIFIPSKVASAEEVKELLKGDGPMAVMTLNKKREAREKDIRPFILPGASAGHDGNYTVMNLRTLAGSRDHLNLDHLLTYLKENIDGYHAHRFTPVRRIEMYTRQGSRFIPLSEI